MKTFTRATLVALICCISTTIYLQTLAPATWQKVKEALTALSPAATAENPIKEERRTIESVNTTTATPTTTPASTPSVFSPFMTIAPVAVTIGATLSAAVVTDNAPTGASATDVLEYTAVLSNTGSTDATGVVFTDVLDNNTTLVAGSVTATPIAVNDAYTCVGNVGIVVNAASGVLANDVSPTNITRTVTAASGATTNGTYSIAADGSFSYTPNAGFTGTNSFTYTLNTGTLTTTATVTITVSGMIWFVNAAAASSGTGTLASPFKAISNIAGTATGNTIFLYTGTYTGSLTLLAAQKLIGQGATTAFNTIPGITPPSYSNVLPATGGTNPTWNTAALTLNSGNDVEGINLNSTTGTTMTGGSVGALKVRDVSLNNTAGQALQITAGGALDVIFKSISAASAAKGISVNSSTGSFQVLGTSTTAGSGGTISSITDRGVEFVSCTNVTLKNMNFVNANTTNGTAFATTDISGSNGAIYCSSVSGVSLDNIQMNTTTGNVNAQNGINLNNVSAFSLANSTITRCGTGNEEACIMAINTSGACSITNSTISKSSRCVRFTNNSVNMTLTVRSSSFNDTRTFIDPVTPTPDTQLNPDGQAGILVEGFGSSVMNLDVNSACNFLRLATSGVDALASDNAVVTADIQNSTFNSTNANLTTGNDVGLGVRIQSGVNGSVKFNILNNTITGRGGDLINVGATATNGKMEGTIKGNTINYNFQSSINNNAGSGIGIVHASASTGNKVKIDQNTITNIAGTSGISANVSGGSNCRADITCTNNTITLITTNYGSPANVAPPSYAFVIGSVGTSTICSKIANNTSNVGVLGIARIRAATATDIHLVEGSGLGSDNINNLGKNLGYQQRV